MNDLTMDHPIRRLLHIVSITVLLSTGYSKPCTVAVVEECAKPLAGYDLTATIVPVFDEPGLAKRCQDYELFEECMRDVKSNCGATDRLLFEGIEDSNKWLCVEAKDQYLTYQECFADTDLHRELRGCYATYNNQIDSLVSSSSSLERICQYANEYLDCIDGDITSSCGAEAATWQRTFERKTLEPVTDSIDCVLDGTSSAPPTGEKTTMLMLVMMSVGLLSYNI